jgi:hypothetical protein
MSALNKMSRWVALGMALVAPGLAYAQSCALCYTQAAGSGSRMIGALRSGILILMFPPMVICLGITWMAYKKRNQFNEYEKDADIESNEP